MALLALGLGLLIPCLLGELVARLLWSRLAPPIAGADDPARQVVDPLSRGEELGEALRREASFSPTSELLLRADGRDTCHELDPDRVPRLRPGRQSSVPRGDGTDATYLVRVDERGCRGPTRPPLEPGGLRLLAIGDSMTFGKGVDDPETWCASLEPLLSTALGRPVRVDNGGIVGLGPREELHRLEALLPVLQPDVVLVQFTVANDALDALRWREGSRQLEPDPGFALELRDSAWLSNPLARWSRAYRWLAWNQGRHALRYRLMQSPAALDRAAALLAAMRERAAPRPFGVLIAPTVGQVEGSRADRWVDTEAINRGIAERLRARGIPCLDPLPQLRARASAGESLYIPIDRHWNPAGHRAVASALVPFVKELVER